MASISSFSSILAISLASPRRCRGKNLAVSPSPSQFLTCISVLKLKKQIFPTTIRFNNFKSPRTRARPVVFASQSNFFRGKAVLPVSFLHTDVLNMLNFLAYSEFLQVLTLIRRCIVALDD